MRMPRARAAVHAYAARGMRTAPARRAARRLPCAERATRAPSRAVQMNGLQVESSMELMTATVTSPAESARARQMTAVQRCVGCNGVDYCQ